MSAGERAAPADRNRARSPDRPSSHLSWGDTPTAGARAEGAAPGTSPRPCPPPFPERPGARGWHRAEPSAPRLPKALGEEAPGAAVQKDNPGAAVAGRREVSPRSDGCPGGGRDVEAAASRASERMFLLVE